MTVLEALLLGFLLGACFVVGLALLPGEHDRRFRGRR